MSITGIVRVSGCEGLKYGHVVASIHIRSHDEARALQEILCNAMRGYAGHPVEQLLAEWHNDLVETRERARSKKWVGWE